MLIFNQPELSLFKHFLNSPAYLFFLMLVGVSVDRRQRHHRFNPDISIGENPVNPLTQFAQNDVFCTGKTIKIVCGKPQIQSYENIIRRRISEKLLSKTQLQLHDFIGFGMQFTLM